MMKTRRQFLAAGAVAAAGVALSGCLSSGVIASPRSFKTGTPRRGLVLWFSQTGHTERMGKIIADAWARRGVAVDYGDIRDFDITALSHYDCVAAGSPVFYYEAPGYVRSRLKQLPALDGAAAVAFTTYGGAGHNQHNAACSLLEILVEKGGVPAGLETFGNMSTFAPTWSALGNEARILRYRHLPDRTTFEQARLCADGVLQRMAGGDPLAISRRRGPADLAAGSFSIGLTKLMITGHEIRRDTCIRCFLCVDACPVDVIDIDAGTVNHSGCVACMACINNCPVRAFDMRFVGRPVYGFSEFLTRHGIRIEEPALQRI